MPLLQPPAPPPAADVLRAEAHFVSASSRDTPLVLTNRAKRVENALVRYQLYINSRIQAVSSDGAAPECTWTLTSILQRQICFTSMTGLFGCTNPTLSDLPEVQNGHSKLTAADEISDCSLLNPDLKVAEQQLAQTLSATASARFDADLKLAVTPMFTRAGATVKRGG